MIAFYHAERKSLPGVPDYDVPPLQRHELRHLRLTLGWSQARLGEFLGRDAATISRWESGERGLDPLAASVLHGLWGHVFGAYEGPYPAPHTLASGIPAEVRERLGTWLLAAGVGYFILKGLERSADEDDDE